MVPKNAKSCCGPGNKGGGLPGMCCSVESIVSVDARGQLVLPKDVREKAGIEPGDKLTVVTCGDGCDVNMIALIRSNDFQKMVTDFMGPMMGEGGKPKK